MSDTSSATPASSSAAPADDTPTVSRGGAVTAGVPPAPAAELAAPIVEEPIDVPAAPATEPHLALHDFCRRASRTIRSPELLAAFAHVQRADGKHRDTSVNYHDRLAAFGKVTVEN